MHLSFGDVSVDNQESPRQLRVRLKASKTDPFRAGVDVFVGATGNDLCPVSAVLSFLVVRGAAPGPLFKFQDGTPLTRARLVVEVQKALEAAGAGHSFRNHGSTEGHRGDYDQDAAWADGKVMPFNFTSKPPGINWRLTHIVWLNPHKLDASSELY